MIPYYRKTPVLIARLLSALLAPFLRGVAALFFRAPKNQRMKILVQEGYRLGDILLCSPALRHLRAAFPEADMHLLTFAGGARLIEHSGWADRIVTLAPFWAFRHTPVQAAREWLRGVKLLRRERYDCAIDLRGDPRGLSMLYCAGIHRRISFVDFGGGCFCSRGYRTPRRIDHQMTRCCWLVEQVTGSRVRECTRPLWPPQPSAVKDQAVALAELLPSAESANRPVLVHPGSSAARKFWPPEQFAGLIDRLTENGTACALVGAETDREPLRTIQSLTHHQCPVFVPSFAQLEQLLAQAACLVCVDSFVQHAAWALGVPCVVLYGPGSPLQTAPIEGECRVVWNNAVLSPPYTAWNAPRDMGRNKEDTVLAAVREVVGDTTS